MAEHEAIIITFKCKRCRERHEILIPSHKIYQYLNKEEITASRDKDNN